MTLSINSLKDRIFRSNEVQHEIEQLLNKIDRIREEMEQLVQEIYQALEPDKIYILPEMQGLCVRTHHPDNSTTLITFERVETLLPPVP